MDKKNIICALVLAGIFCELCNHQDCKDCKNPHVPHENHNPMMNYSYFPTGITASASASAIDNNFKIREL